MTESRNRRLTEEGVQQELQSQPHLLMRLAENALTVGENLRDNYFKNTARFVASLRQAIQLAKEGKRQPVLEPVTVSDASWAEFQNEVVTFIDGGIGSVEISSQIPILLRVGSYSVRTGETKIRNREQFGYYPVILGDLQGGSKERKDFPDIVRISAELLGGLSALQRTPDLRILMFHGPLVYLVGNYAGHTPFTEQDIDLFLRHYASEASLGRELKERFLNEAYVEIYPKMTPAYPEWANKRLFEPLAWMSFLYRALVQEAKKRNPVPIIAGVVERGALREFSETVLLERVFRGLRAKGNGDYFNSMFGRKDLNSPTSLLDKLGYNDALLLGMVLQPGEMSDPWRVSKYAGLRKGQVSLPGESKKEEVDFYPLRPPGQAAFPEITGAYIHVSDRTEPIRVEVFSELGDQQIFQASRRVYLYSRLLPGYGFPVGLDIADKYAKVPNWMTSAYSKLIRWQLGVSLQKGEISDSEMRRILVQAIYVTHRDWLFRPKV